MYNPIIGTTKIALRRQAKPVKNSQHSLLNIYGPSFCHACTRDSCSEEDDEADPLDQWEEVRLGISFKGFSNVLYATVLSRGGGRGVGEGRGRGGKGEILGRGRSRAWRGERRARYENLGVCAPKARISFL